jgi:hypothetical protein
MSILLSASTGLWLLLLCQPPTPVNAGPAAAVDSSDARSFVCLDSSYVVVSRLASAVPSDSTALHSFLWDAFINGPDSNRFDCLVSDCDRAAPSFVRNLVRKAAVASLPAESLAKCLAVVQADRGRNAHLPISATYATYMKAPVWIILVKWEWVDSSAREVLGHARVYVLDAHHTRIIAFATCG